MKRKLSFLLLLIMLVNVFAISASASAESTESGITPYWNNTAMCVTNFSVVDDIAYVSVEYFGDSDTFSSAEISVKIQKRFLLLFWDTVETWTASSTEENDYLYADIPISSGTGKYRAKFTIDIYGTDGTVDNIEDTIECDYE